MSSEEPRTDGLARMTEIVNSRTGAIRVSGRLTAQGADLLRGTVEGLRNSGHTRVVLDLRDVRETDAAGLHVLRGVARKLEEQGALLMVRDRPGGLCALS